jgi:hypothetical protein
MQQKIMQKNKTAAEIFCKAHVFSVGLQGCKKNV